MPINKHTYYLMSIFYKIKILNSINDKSIKKLLKFLMFLYFNKNYLDLYNASTMFNQ